jgi:hypothetical protein
VKTFFNGSFSIVYTGTWGCQSIDRSIDRMAAVGPALSIKDLWMDDGMSDQSALCHFKFIGITSTTYNIGSRIYIKEK